MIIGIDASRAVKFFKTGTEYYSLRIIQELIQLSKTDIFQLYIPKSLPSSFKLTSNTQVKTMPFPRLWSQIRLSFEVKLNPPDILFEPAHTIPVFHSRPVVITLHDLGFKYFPELYTPFERLYHNFSMDFSAQQADKIIAVSQATARDIVKFYPQTKSKIQVIYHGYDKKYYFQATKETPHKIKKHQPYFYFIGRLERKKNIEFLIQVFENFKEKTKSLPAERRRKHKLVLAGRPGYGFLELKEQIRNLPSWIKQDILLLGYINEKEAGLWMRNAEIFLFPSLFEGFGMPLLEAMASGAPVIASNSTSIPEVVGEAGILLAPRNKKEWVTNIQKLLGDSRLKRRLIEKGLKRAKDFSWKKAGQETFQVIKETHKNQGFRVE